MSTIVTQPPVTPVSGSTYFGLGQPSVTDSGSTIDMPTFLKLLTDQLSNQDPLNPVSDSDFAAQLAQLGTVEGMNNMQQSSQVQEAASLLGKTVTAVNPDVSTLVSSPTVTGVVVNLINQSGQYQIGIQDASGNITDVSTNSIQSVSN